MGTTDSGKILRSTFERTIWQKNGAPRPTVVAGPCYGVDVSVVQLPGDLLLVSASDPASLIPGLGLAESAWLTVHLTANDLATTGHRPMYAQLVLNLPVTISDAEFETYWGYIHQYCSELGVAITGGHTGKVPGQESTFAGGVTMSLVADRVLLSSNLRPGLRLLVTKTCALSACAILAKCFPETVTRVLGVEEGGVVRDSFWQTSVLEEAVAAYQSGKAVALHDVTEGGVLGAVVEMCGAGSCGAVIEQISLPVTESVARLAAHFGFDPARSLGSGALLVACEPSHEQELIALLADIGIPAAAIGHTTEQKGEVILRDAQTGNEQLLTGGKKDSYWQAYLQALEKGWR